MDNERVTHCNRCKDAGMFGGKLPPGQYAGPWKWCDCVAAVELRDREPDAVEKANKARDRLMSLAPKVPA